MKHIILGTAGHIDHGKSALVKALTGIDPDRLKEEKRRGITIDLGFADLHYPDGLTVGIVDVPGHERLVKNMLAGAGGIDMVLLVVAADEGVMPQSREHLAICNLLGIKKGIIVITKCDLVEDDWLELVKDDVREFVRGSFLEDAEIVTVSSKTGQNIKLLKEKIHHLALETEQKSSDGLFRLPIDRVFTLKGFGTVVTGTAISGRLSLDEPVEILPSGLKSKVRGLQSHGRSIETAFAGQRVAINLQGIEKQELKRGDVVVTPDGFTITQTIDVKLRLLEDAPSVKTKTNVHFHLGTSEAIARVILYDTEELKPSEEAYCQLRLDRPVVAVSGDRFVIRRFSPVITIGGGVILDSLAKRRKKKEGIDDLIVFEKGTLEEKIVTKVKKMGLKGMERSRLEGWIKGELTLIRKTIEELKKGGELLEYDRKLLHREVYQRIKDRIIDTLERFHKNNPLKPGMQKEVLRNLFNLKQTVFQGILSITDEIVVERDTVRLKDFSVEVTDHYSKVKERVVNELKKAGFQPPSNKELAELVGLKEKEMDDILKLMVQEGTLRRITDSFYLTSEDYQKMLELIDGYFQKNPTMTVGQFRDLLGTTRKYALPMLEHLDSNKITLRVQDVRKRHPAFKKH
ncbi:MAG: selenocysteine-specific translation elongation factor [Nitrospirae bacterium]|nr:MAG: selenocysteine-specific translation elongation factor [Nitrospirota bacterium]